MNGQDWGVGEVGRTSKDEELEQTNEVAQLAVENDVLLQEMEDRANDYEEEKVDLFVQI